MIPYGQAVSLPPLSSLWYNRFETSKANSEETAVWMPDVEKLAPNSTAGFITWKYKKVKHEMSGVRFVEILELKTLLSGFTLCGEAAESNVSSF